MVSVTLLLVTVGVIALAAAAATGETRRLRERLEVTLVLNDSVSDNAARSLAARLADLPYTNTVQAVTKKEALEQWQSETGEDLEALFGVNPLSPEVSFTLRHRYSHPDSLQAISQALSRLPDVQGIALPDAAMVSNMNRNIETVSIILGGIALALIVISFVLINNTVHLAVYARRFTIHTMQLVGATDGFIRRPYIASNMLSGLIAGLIASGVLAAVLLAAPRAGWPDVADILPWTLFAAVAAILIALGVALCGTAAAISTTRHLHTDYNELFR